MHYFFNISIDDIDFSESRYFELYIDNETGQKNVRYLKGDNKIKMNTTYEIFKNIVKQNIWNNTKIYEFCFPNENENKVEDNFLKNYTTLYRYMDSFVCDEKDQRDFSYLNILQIIL